MTAPLAHLFTGHGLDHLRLRPGEGAAAMQQQNSQPCIIIMQQQHSQPCIIIMQQQHSQPCSIIMQQQHSQPCSSSSSSSQDLPDLPARRCVQKVVTTGGADEAWPLPYSHTLSGTP